VLLALGDMKGGFVPETGDPAPEWVVEIIGETAMWCADCSAWHIADFDHEEIAAPVTVQAPSYSNAREIHANGTDVGLITCNLCGCLLILDAADVVSSTEIHDRWHHSGN
jgi:hypothetical protein